MLEADSLPNKPTKDGESKPRRIFLFEMRLTVSDVKQDSLCIPVEFALDHFPPIPQRSPRLYREKVKILSATQDRVWPMTIRYHPEDSVFLLNSKWKEFAQSHEMKAKDMIRFYTPLPRYPDKQYMVVHVKRNPQDDVVISAQDCTKENLLFDHQLTYFDLNFGLMLSKEVVRKYFPAVGIPAETHKIERLYFTDSKNTDWCMEITMYYNHYIIGRGWRQCVQDYNLEPEDLISFYEHVQPLNSRHFLIRLQKRLKEAETSKLTQEGGISERKDDRGGDGKGGDEPQGDGGGGRSDCGSSKEKKSRVGHCFMALK